ncbi:MAG: hypothetical protein FWE27_02380 [Defluviitaleaceae bacterium]|nr:hypothetical protein [Defluviitaleaceae bacterium]
MSRDEIIKKLELSLEPLPYAYALWLEGADANETVDEYSDLDFWLDFEDEYEAQIINDVEAVLCSLGDIDFKYVMNHNHPKIRQRVYHLNGTSEYLMIDFCWQLHSRTQTDDGILIKGDKIEAAKIIFDKKNVVRYKDYNPSDFSKQNDERLSEIKYRYSQHSRVIKYVRREQYAEAYAYYNRYVIEPLVDLLRLIHTPAHADYYLVHISQHIPVGEIERLEYFLRVSSLEDIEKKTEEARFWFDELSKVLHE